MNRLAWISFWMLGTIWGSSFLLIRVGVEDIPASELALIRIGIATIGLNIVRMTMKLPLPRDWPTIRAFILIGAGNSAFPFVFIGLGEQHITSGMAAVLQSTASLFTLVVAHFYFADERMNWRKVAGLIVGFIGVIFLYSNSITDGKIDTNVFLGQMAIVVASLCYAFAIVYARAVIQRQISPVTVSAGTFIAATGWAFLLVLLEPLFGGRAFISPVDLPSKALQAVITLGVLNTFVAYILYYYIISTLGSFRASMVTYIVPVVGLILGTIFLDEIVTPTMIIGAVMIFTGIGIVNLRSTPVTAPAKA